MGNKSSKQKVSRAANVVSDDGAELLSGGTAMSYAFERAAEKAASMVEKDVQEERFLDKVVSNIKAGSASVVSTVGYVPLGASYAIDETRRFFAGLKPVKTEHVSLPSQPLPEIQYDLSPETSVASQTTEEGEEDNDEDDEEVTTETGFKEGQLYIDYQKFPVKQYVKLPKALSPFLKISVFEHYLLVSRPSMAKSAGLVNHRAVVPKKLRKAVPFMIVIDEPGMLQHWQDKKYTWVEIPLLDVFKLDVSSMHSMDDYLNVLSRKGRWNFKDRQKKFNNPTVINMEYVPLDKSMIGTLWPLYQATGEKNGFTVLSKADFFKFHNEVEGLTVMYIYDVRDPENKKLVSFCTGIKAGDALLPMWCGTDYENDLQRTCATYFNMLYEFVRIAIADPEVNWVDLGATRRTAKTAIGFTGYPHSGYFRCKNTVVQAIVESMAKDYFKPEDFAADP